MYSPAARERVEVADRGGVFLVLSVDTDESTADVVALEGHAYVLSDVPFSLIQPYKRELVRE